MKGLKGTSTNKKVNRIVKLHPNITDIIVAIIDFIYLVVMNLSIGSGVARHGVWIDNWIY
jgi:hypothetical protein